MGRDGGRVLGPDGLEQPVRIYQNRLMRKQRSEDMWDRTGRDEWRKEGPFSVLWVEWRKGEEIKWVPNLAHPETWTPKPLDYWPPSV